MIERKSYTALMRLAKQFPVVAITGPRQSGKSTLTKYAFPDKKYISFDDKNLRELAKSNPGDFLKAFPDGVIYENYREEDRITTNNARGIEFLMTCKYFDELLQNSHKILDCAA